MFKQLLQDFNKEKYSVDYSRIPKRICEGTVLDEQESILWNRKEIEKINKEREDFKEQLKLDQMQLYNKFDEEVINISKENSPLTEKNIKMLYNFCKDKFTVSIPDRIHNFQELLEIVSKF